jgi:hypothetical protein
MEPTFRLVGATVTLLKKYQFGPFVGAGKKSTQEKRL